MIKITKASFLVIFLLIFTLDNYSQTKTIKPKNSKSKISTIVNGKKRTYYSIPSKEPAIITVKGPGELRIFTRGRFTPGSADQLSYYMSYSINGTDHQTVDFNNIKKSMNAEYKNNKIDIPSDSRTIKIELGLGYHTIEIKTANDDVDVAARYRFTKKKIKKQVYISHTPIPPCEPIDLITREDVVHYYRFSKKSPLKFEIIGPTFVRVLTRAEFEYNMKGRINYRIQVRESENVLNTYLLSSVCSEITNYKHNGKLMPGKAREIGIKVPSGKHVYEIIPLDHYKKTVLGKILFPKKDVKLEH